MPVASTSGGTSSVVTYAVTVTLTSPPETVLAGMSATVTVTTASVENALRVPATALQGSSTAGYTVQVVNADGNASTQDVQVGLVTTSMAQITGGLSSMVKRSSLAPPLPAAELPQPATAASTSTALRVAAASAAEALGR